MFKKIFSRGKQLVQPSQRTSAQSTAGSSTAHPSSSTSTAGSDLNQTRPPTSPRSPGKSESLLPADPAAPVFGVPLDVAAQRSRLVQTAPSQEVERVGPEQLFQFWLPAVACQCLDYLDQYVSEEGLYRVPGSSHMVHTLQHNYDQTGAIQLAGTPGLQIADVASLFKLYLRELPHRLIHTDLAARLEQAPTPQIDESWHAELRTLLAQLRPYEFYLLRRLCEHLCRVQAVAETSKMTVSNLCIVFCSSSNLGIGANVLSKLIASSDLWQGLRSEGEADALALERQTALVQQSAPAPAKPPPAPAEEQKRIKAQRRKSLWPIR